MAGLDPAIHEMKPVDPRDKPGDDGSVWGCTHLEPRRHARRLPGKSFSEERCNGAMRCLRQRLRQGLRDHHRLQHDYLRLFRMRDPGDGAFLAHLRLKDMAAWV